MIEEKKRQILLNRILEKLDSFKELRRGWFNPFEGHGEIISNDLIEGCKKLIRELYYPPEVFPLCDGGIQIEWTLQPDLSCEIELWNSADLNKFYIFIADFRSGDWDFRQIVNADKETLNNFLKEAIDNTLNITKLEKYQGQ